MTGYLNGKPKTQITEILHDGYLFDSEEIVKALKEVKRKKKKKES